MASRWKMVHGNTHSRGAIEAEARGEMPITRAVKEVYAKFECKKKGITQKQVKQFLSEHCYTGPHHISGPNEVRYVGYYATDLDEDKTAQLLALAKNPGGSCPDP